MMEDHLISEHFVYQKSLSNTTSAIDGDEFWPSAIPKSFQFSDFLLSSNDSAHRLGAF